MITKSLKKVHKKRKLNALYFSEKIIKEVPYKVQKYVGFDIAQQVDSSTPHVLLINSLIQGTTNNTRIGNAINIQSVQMKLLITPTSRPSNIGTGLCNSSNCIKLSIVYDKQPTGVLPTYNGATTSIFNGLKPTDLPQISMSGRFTILYTMMYTPNAISFYNVQTGGTTSISCVDYCISDEVFRKIALPAKFNGNDVGDITDFNEGAIYLCLTGANPVAGSGVNNTSQVICDTRVRFTDV